MEIAYYDSEENIIEIFDNYSDFSSDDEDDGNVGKSDYRQAVQIITGCSDMKESLQKLIYHPPELRSTMPLLDDLLSELLMKIYNEKQQALITCFFQ